MVNWITNDIISFLLALVLVGILIPQILLVAFHKNLFDKIDDRKVHKGVIPRLGGLAFFPSILFSLAFVVGLNLTYGNFEDIVFFPGSVAQMCFLICAVLLLFFIGILDDLVGVRYMSKFIVQILASVFVIIGGVTIENLHGFLWLYELPQVLAWVITSFVIVYIVNAINLIDGIDGLASGISTVAFIFFAVFFYFYGEYVCSMLSSAAAGTLFPFFYYNVFGSVKKQKKIFMGDTGALTIGMILAFCSIVVLHSDDAYFQGSYNLVIIAISPFIIPCFDLVRVSLHRLKKRRNPFLPDKSHIHHKLLALGLTQHMALFVIMFFTIAFIIMNLSLSPLMNSTIILCIDVVIWTLLNVALTYAIKEREKKLGKKLYR